LIYEANVFKVSRLGNGAYASNFINPKFDNLDFQPKSALFITKSNTLTA